MAARQRPTMAEAGRRRPPTPAAPVEGRASRRPRGRTINGRSRRTLEAAAGAWFDELAALGRSTATIHAYQTAVRHVLPALSTARRPADLVRELPAGIAASTRQTYLSGVRGFVGYLAETGNAWARGLAALPTATAAPGLPRPIPAAALVLLDAAARQVPLAFGDRRAYRLVRLLYLVERVTGIRTADALALDCGDVDLADGAERLNLKPGKNGQARPVDIVRGSRPSDQLVRALAGRLAKWPHGPAVPLFYSRHGGRWSGRQARRAWSAFARRAGAPGFTLHQLRHTRASELAAGGMSPHQLRRVMGWSSLHMATIYVDAGDTRAAIARAQAAGPVARPARSKITAGAGGARPGGRGSPGTPGGGSRRRR